MGAKRAHSAKGRLAKKNGDMASMMKKLGVRRTHSNCPLCHRPVRLPFDNWNRHKCR